MKKKHRFLQKKENVIVFPGMVETLIADGLAFAEESNYIKAALCFDEAKKYIKLDDMILSVYVLTLLETRRPREAKEICESLLAEKSPVFEQMVELYLTILVELKEYKELDHVLIRLLRDYNFSQDRINSLLQLKDLSIRLAAEQDILIEVEDSPLVIEMEKEKLELEYFTSLRFPQQEQLLQQAFHKNIIDSISEIKAIAESESIAPTIQTLALLLLGSAEVSDEVTMKKFGFKGKVNPSVLPANTAIGRRDAITEYVHEFLQKDPSKLALTTELVHRHAYALFPFEWEGYQDETVALTYIDYVDTLFGIGSLQSNPLLDLIKLVEDSLEVVDNE
ncbi:hypothetical protein MHH81_13740 [Psychrobacillus sp. FSL H8-0484]|uniref:hypothetical protein n=1 Tax=Psychrobacillus sp. FSL H8-0484 TaxID=2921390 RepID=UPI0030F718E3